MRMNLICIICVLRVLRGFIHSPLSLYLSLPVVSAEMYLQVYKFLIYQLGISPPLYNDQPIQPLDFTITLFLPGVYNVFTSHDYLMVQFPLFMPFLKRFFGRQLSDAVPWVSKSWFCSGCALRILKSSPKLGSHSAQTLLETLSLCLATPLPHVGRQVGRQEGRLNRQIRQFFPLPFQYSFKR